MDRRRPQSALVVGAGSIARRHLSNLRQLGVQRLSACDPHPDRLTYVKEHFQAVPCRSIEEGLENRPDIVLICTPPHFHTSQALQAICTGAHVFIEKPVSDCVENLEALQQERQDRGLIVQVGYNLRFHPPVQKLKELVESEAVGKILWGRVEAGSYLPDWRPWQNYRDSYTASRELGGGIILDGSHELDYVTWLFGTPSELTCMAGQVSSLDVDVEDCATILLRFPRGAQIDVHVDFMQRFYSRGCVLAGENGRLQWDFTSKTVEVQRSGEEAQKMSFDCDVNHMYLTEMRHFLDCAERGASPRFSLEEAICTLRVALAARRAAEERRWLTLD